MVARMVALFAVMLWAGLAHAQSSTNCTQMGNQIRCSTYPRSGVDSTIPLQIQNPHFMTPMEAQQQVLQLQLLQQQQQLQQMQIEQMRRQEAETKGQAKREEQAKTPEEERKAKAQEQITALHKTFNERVAKAAPEYPDYADKVTNNERLILNNGVFFTIEQSEMAPHILYYLAEHPEEAARLNSMMPADGKSIPPQVFMRVGELAAEIRVARKPNVSKGAEPIKPVGSQMRQQSNQ